MDMGSNGSITEENTSGGGRDILVPSVVDRWNWGAFFLTWIWGVFNGVYAPVAILIVLVASDVSAFLMPLLLGKLLLGIISMFAGLAYFIISIVAGIKGNQWAWRAKHWSSIEDFSKIQRRWALASLILILLGFVAAIGVLFYQISALPPGTSIHSAPNGAQYGLVATGTGQPLSQSGTNLYTYTDSEYNLSYNFSIPAGSTAAQWLYKPKTIAVSDVSSQQPQVFVTDNVVTLASIATTTRVDSLSQLADLQLKGMIVGSSTLTNFMAQSGLQGFEIYNTKLGWSIVVDTGKMFSGQEVFLFVTPPTAGGFDQFAYQSVGEAVAKSVTVGK
jgi:hypothetical protein